MLYTRRQWHGWSGGVNNIQRWNEVARYVANAMSTIHIEFEEKSSSHPAMPGYAQTLKVWRELKGESTDGILHSTFANKGMHC